MTRDRYFVDADLRMESIMLIKYDAELDLWMTYDPIVMKWIVPNTSQGNLEVDARYTGDYEPIPVEEVSKYTDALDEKYKDRRQ